MTDVQSNPNKPVDHAAAVSTLLAAADKLKRLESTRPTLRPWNCARAGCQSRSVALVCVGCRNLAHLTRTFSANVHLNGSICPRDNRSPSRDYSCEACDMLRNSRKRKYMDDGGSLSSGPDQNSGGRAVHLPAQFAFTANRTALINRGNATIKSAAGKLIVRVGEATNPGPDKRKRGATVHHKRRSDRADGIGEAYARGKVADVPGFRVHGAYTGPSQSGGLTMDRSDFDVGTRTDFDVRPIDALDAAARRHDLEYAASDASNARRESDSKLASAADRYKPRTWRDAAEREIVRTGMRMKAIGEYLPPAETSLPHIQFAPLQPKKPGLNALDRKSVV